MENFGQRLRNLRGSRSQREVAGDLDMPATTLSTLENQETAPRGEVLQRLAEYFKVPVNYFFRTPEMEPKGSDAARAWLAKVRQPVQGKMTVATSASEIVDELTKERIARALREKYAEVSQHK